ncbi:MAG: hypothetical protein KAT00_05695 [Planctomycetes bacterium]|nr:hypothetical protein [Planctomycetota bacterium]
MASGYRASLSPRRPTIWRVFFVKLNLVKCYYARFAVALISWGMKLAEREVDVG